MTSWKQLHRGVQSAIVVPYLFIAALLCASTPGFRQLLLDASNHPTTAVDFGSTNFTGTLAAARLPTTPNFSSIGATTPGTGKFSTLSTTGSLTINGSLTSDNGKFYSNGNGNISTQNATIYGELGAHGPVYIYSSADIVGDVTINSSLSVFGSAMFDSGDTYSDGEGDLIIGNSLTSDGYSFSTDGVGDVSMASLRVAGSVSVWGAFGPGEKPTTPTSLAQVIALLQSYGFCQ